MSVMILYFRNTLKFGFLILLHCGPFDAQDKEGFLATETNMPHDNLISPVNIYFNLILSVFSIIHIFCSHDYCNKSIKCMFFAITSQASKGVYTCLYNSLLPIQMNHFRVGQLL